MSDLVTFLRARLDEDEATAKAAQAENPTPWEWGHTAPGMRTAFALYDARRGHVIGCSAGGIPGNPAAFHIARHDPARVLADVQAKRGLLADAGDVPTISMRRALQWVALPYADHPDYDERWRP